MSDAATLSAELDRRCLDGLTAVAAVLAGDDPAPVCRSFAAWKHLEAWRSWPWLPGLCWTALDWLGAAFPVDDDHAITLGRFVVGAETDAERVRAALVAARRPVGGRPPLVSGPDLAVELRRQTLEAAVDRFWEELRRAAARLREPVVAGDRAGADAIVVTARRRLEEVADRIDAHAQTLAQALPEVQVGAAGSPGLAAGTEAPEPDTAEPDAAEPERDAAGAAPYGPPADPAPPERARAEPEPDEEPIVVTDGRSPVTDAGAAVGAARVPGGDPKGATGAPEGAAGGLAEPATDGDDVEYRQIREHRLAPLLFLAAVTLVALIWLVVIGSR